MRKSPSISVLITVYNTSFYLIKRAIDSVLNQDFNDEELILIDDGSHNDSHNQLMNYIKSEEDQIIYIRHQNCGQSISSTGVSSIATESILPYWMLMMNISPTT